MIIRAQGTVREKLLKELEIKERIGNIQTSVITENGLITKNSVAILRGLVVT